MFSEAQTEKLLRTQKRFLSFPGVKEPKIVELYCVRCGETGYQLKCCNSIWCPICNLKLSWKTSKIIKKINKKVPGHYIRLFITLTLKNTHTITAEHFRYYRKMFIRKLIRKKEIKEILIGGLYSFDWTINSKHPLHTYNIHIHLLAYATRFIPVGKLSECWREITGGSYIVDIRYVKNTSKAIAEVQKYIQSNKSILYCEKRHREELIRAVQSIRRFSRFGIAYQVKIEKEKKKCQQCGGKIYWTGREIYSGLFGI